MNLSSQDKIYSTAKIAIMVDLLAEEGIPAERALAGVFLSSEQLRSPATRVSVAQVLQSCRNAIRLSRNSQLAYHASSKFRVSTYGIYGLIALSSPNFREAIAFATAYHQLATPLVQIDFREEERTAAWIVTSLPYLETDGPLYEFIIKLQMGAFLSLRRKMMGAAFKPAQVDYALVQPHSEGDETVFFDCPVRHGQPENRFARPACSDIRRAKRSANRSQS